MPDGHVQDNANRQASASTEAQLEAVAFADGARTWLDHGLSGDVWLDQAVDAAQRLLNRASRWLEVAA